ncbi:MAG: carbohydrate ABC transporter substrate-binding protein [Spirochaetales bacterium]|nr:carbohydrate ABC transporter substrate-binding protein [Spirochaetales bacterium]
MKSSKCHIMAIMLLIPFLMFANGQNEKKSNSKPTVITFGSHQSGLPSSGIVQEIAKEYEKETGIKIEFQIVPDAQWRDLLKVKLNAGEAPDIFCADADPFSLYDRIRPDINCVDVTNEEFTSRMDKSVLPGISYNGSVYGITFPGPKIWYYFYNKEIFNNLGLEAPTSYAEFKAVSQKIKDAGITPVYEALQNGWHQVLPLFETGPYYEELEPGLYDKLNNNKMNVRKLAKLEEIITQLNEFAQLGFYGDDFMSNSVEGDFEAIANGEAAMVLEGYGWGQQLMQDYPEMKGKLGFFVMPWGDNQTIGINPGSNAYFANKRSENAQAALDFFAYLAKPENLEKRLAGDPQALNICWPEASSKMPPEYSAYYDAHKKGNVMQYGVKYIDTQWMDVGQDLEAMYVGAMTPADVMDSISRRRDEQATIQKDPAWVK